MEWDGTAEREDGRKRDPAITARRRGSDISQHEDSRPIPYNTVMYVP